MTDLRCRKIRHTTRKGAKKHLMRLVKMQRGATRRHISVYFCDQCQFWHVGHTNGKSRAQLRKKQEWRAGKVKE